jgi:type II secretory pathway component PulF
VDAGGKRLHGETEAPDATALTRTLEESGLLVLDVEEAKPAGEGLSIGFRFGRRREVLEVTRAMASLLPAGMPLARALDAASNVASGHVASALEATRARVERGETLAVALSHHPDLFSPLYRGIVRAGEKSGDLSAAFQRLSGQLERDEELRAKLLSASIYPMLLAAFGGLAVIVLLIVVIPRFAELLEGTGGVLPRSTAILLGVSNGLRVFWPVLIALPVVVASLFAWTRGAEGGRRLMTAVMLGTPLLRRFKQSAMAAQFARMTGTLLGGGASLVLALDDAVESLDDPVAKDETVRIRSRVHEGSALHEAIQEGTLFPPLLGQLVAVGEESSRLPEFLLKAAEIFEAKTERAMQRLVTVVEPAMILFFGTVVAVVALSLLQAIYSVNAGAFR